MHDLRLSAGQADHQLAGKRVSHMQTLCYILIIIGKQCPKYRVFYMSARVLLNLLNALKKRDKMQ